MQIATRFFRLGVAVLIAVLAMAVASPWTVSAAPSSETDSDELLAEITPDPDEPEESGDTPPASSPTPSAAPPTAPAEQNAVSAPKSLLGWSNSDIAKFRKNSLRLPGTVGKLSASNTFFGENLEFQIPVTRNPKVMRRGISAGTPTPTNASSVHESNWRGFTSNDLQIDGVLHSVPAPAAMLPGLTPDSGPVTGGTETRLGTDFAFIDVAANSSSSVGLDAWGRPWIWGMPKNQNDFTPIATPVPLDAPARTFVAVAGASFTDRHGGMISLLDSTGAAWMVGDGRNAGQLGNGTLKLSSTAAVPVSMPSGISFVKVSPGANHVTALDTQGRLWGWGRGGELAMLDPEDPDGNEIYSTPVRLNVPDDMRFADIAAGATGSLAIDMDGKAWSIGALDLLGRFMCTTGDDDETDPHHYLNARSDFHQIATPSGVTFTAANTNSLVHSLISSTGDAYLWGCSMVWGDGNVIPEDSTSMASIVSFRNEPIELTRPGGIAWAQVEASLPTYMVGRADDGSVWSWGLNTSGELGHSNSVLSLMAQMEMGSGAVGPPPASEFDERFQVPSPKKIPNIKATKLAAPLFSTLALRADGRITGWGHNAPGDSMALGDGFFDLVLTSMVGMFEPGCDVDSVLGGMANSYFTGEEFDMMGACTLRSDLPSDDLEMQHQLFEEVGLSTDPNFAQFYAYADELGATDAVARSTLAYFGMGMSHIQRDVAQPTLSTDTVVFEDSDATNVTPLDTVMVEAITPAHAAGRVDVTTTHTWFSGPRTGDGGKSVRTLAFEFLDGIGPTPTPSPTPEPESDPELTVSKDAKLDGEAVAGTVIEYTITATNTGNVDMEDVGITDPMPGLSPLTYDWSSASKGGSLAIGETVSATGTYTVTAADIAAGTIINTATVTGTPTSGGDPISKETTNTVPIDPEPGEEPSPEDEPELVTPSPDLDKPMTATGGELRFWIVVTGLLLLAVAAAMRIMFLPKYQRRQS